MNRDYWDEGGNRYVCGPNPNPAQAADSTVVAAKIYADDEKLLATVVNYACHPTTLAWDNTLISPDYPGALRETVEQATGVPCLFLQGASGDLGPRDGYVGDTAVADRNGRQLGYAALSTLESIPFAPQIVYDGAVESGAAIGTWSWRPFATADWERAARWKFWRGAVPLNYRPDLEPTSAIESDYRRLIKAQQDAITAGDERQAAEFRPWIERRRRELVRRAALPADDRFPWQAALLKIGDAIWLTIQGEPYSLLQTELRRRFPQTPIIVASIGFDWSLGYLPIASLYGKNLYQQNIAIVESGSLESGIETIAARIEDLLDEDHSD